MRQPVNSIKCNGREVLKKENMSAYILGLKEIDHTKQALVGGKGANLGELSGIRDIRVPDGFCITTELYRKWIGNNPTVNSLLGRLSILQADERKYISETAAKIRKQIE